MSELLNIAGKIDPNTVAIFETVNSAVTDLDMPYVIVGATARDIVLHHGHGAKIQRATRDVDFAIEVPGWAAFEALKGKLSAQGFKETQMQHRLISPENTVIDVVPFGHVDNDQSFIAWPPKGDIKMNVLGFQEACDSAEWVRIQDEPELDIPVATPAGMMLLKIISWSDRTTDLRRKDAMDIAYFLSNYESMQEVKNALYVSENTQLMETYDWDITLAAAHLLGQHASAIAQENTQQEITEIANGEIDNLNLERLVEEMCENIENHFVRNQQLLTAFFKGFGISA